MKCFYTYEKSVWSKLIRWKTAPVALMDIKFKWCWRLWFKAKLRLSTMYLNFVCRRKGHNWFMVADKRWSVDDFMHYRQVEFRCSRCGIAHHEKRWAFVLGSGALEYFFGRNGWEVMEEVI